MRPLVRKLGSLRKGWGLCQGAGVRCLGSSAAGTQHRVVKSPFAQIEIPEVTLDEFIWRNIDKWADKTAVVCSETGREYSYSQLHATCSRVAQAFRSPGLGSMQRGDVLAVMSPNIPEYCSAVLASVQAGLTVTTVNPVYTPQEVARQLQNSNAKAIVALCALHPVVQAAVKLLGRDIPIITIKHQQTDVTPSGAIDFSELCSYSGPQIDLGRGSSSDLAFLPYSSGTTGLPKGVQLTHKNVVSNLAQVHYKDIRLNLETTSDWQDGVSAVLPMYHIYGLVLVFMNTLQAGCKLITMPRFHPMAYFQMLMKFKPTMLYTAPPIVLFLTNFPEIKKEHLASIRRIMCGAAPLAPSDIERFNDKFDGKARSLILQGYGLTESSPLTHTQRAELDTSGGGIGFPVPNTDCRIVSLDDGKDLGAGETGELVVRGPQVMRGYHNNPEATADTIVDGWLKTGDIGHYNDDGQFVITDRLKELIKVKGFQVAPAELEGILRDCPGVLEAAVTGVPDASSGQVPKAFIVRKPGAAINEDQIKEYLSGKVAPFKRLTGGVVFVDSIPKNPSGKILRRDLQNM